ncbi:MAG: hypothetical protein AB1410_04900 [Acidobacteriota bacterium]
MKTNDWLEFFKNHYDTKIFHFNHLKLLSKMNNYSLRVSLNRLNDRKIIKRICRGYYANPFNLPNLEEISSWIYQPSYISLQAALSSWGILSQIPLILTCVTTRLPRTFKTSFGIIEYHQIKKIYFWGFIRQNNYFIAEKEKALLDFIYLNKNKNIESTLSDLNLSEINHRKLKSYTEKMNLSIPKLF